MGAHLTGATIEASPDGYAYLLPNGWLHLDVSPGRRETTVRQAVRRRVRREPRLAPYLALLDRLLLSECALAAAQGAQRVSLLVEAADGHAVTASVTLVVDSVGGPAAPLDAGEVFEWLVAEQVRVLAGDPLATMDVVGLSQQDGVRRSWTMPVAGSSDGGLRNRHWQLVLPWPGRPSVAVLTMASPCEPMWARLEETFDACAQTFRWTWSSGGGGPGSD